MTIRTKERHFSFDGDDLLQTHKQIDTVEKNKTNVNLTIKTLAVHEHNTFSHKQQQQNQQSANIIK